MRTLTSLLLASLLGGCALAPHRGQWVAASSDWFTVHARDAATAERVLAECEEARPLVLTGFTTGDPRPLEVWAAPVDREYGEGFNWTRGDPELRRFEYVEIEIGRELFWERYVIAHELAHAWLDPLWNPLPQILEEGLADKLGERVDPETGVYRRLHHGLELLSWTGVGFPLTWRDADGRRAGGALHLTPLDPGLPEGLAGMLELDGTTYHHVGGERNRMLLYAVGYALVEQIGVPALRGLCERAASEGRGTVPAEWVLEAAGLHLETDRLWGIRGMRLIGEAEERALERCRVGDGPFRFTME